MECCITATYLSVRNCLAEIECNLTENKDHFPIALRQHLNRSIPKCYPGNMKHHWFLPIRRKLRDKRMSCCTWFSSYYLGACFISGLLIWITGIMEVRRGGWCDWESYEEVLVLNWAAAWNSKWKWLVNNPKSTLSIVFWLAVKTRI